MLPEIAVIEDVLRALGALVPEEKEHRMIRAEIARNDQMRAQIAALREQWQARLDAWQSRFDAEDKPSEYADALTERVYVISVVLEELDALFPPDASA